MIRLHSKNVTHEIPPPLTPPHEGEGNDFITVAVNFVDAWRGATVPQGPPPPCGEGLGVGVSFGAARSARPLIRLPAPSPRHDGEKVDGRYVDAPLSPFFTGRG
ncbi:hypothetical protein GGR00_000794 [Aminobacter aganoensis]|uniref:Uncharacterized protein n=1 Tax=Aminobacter aganoensis TaxID=83264 RepID=A0A7X0F4S2_9HYPH|nr:hypothetical protein [Aminobacter aganoensis]